jgi:hypothetical protein
MATQLAARNLEVVKVSDISDAVVKLQVIMCDVCRINKASQDVLVNGVIPGVTVLKRCCDGCARSIA